jgi:hypothetical protein
VFGLQSKKLAQNSGAAIIKIAYLAVSNPEPT